MIVLSLAVLAAAALVAACGSSSKKSSHTSAATTPATTAATTPASTGTSTTSTGAAPAGAPIKVGMLCDCTGPQAGQIGKEGDVAKAWEKSVNANGGINGHPLQVTVIDVGQDPARALQASKQLIEQDHVITLIDYTLVDAAIAKYVDSKGVPVLGGVSQDAIYLSDPNFYPSSAQLIVQTVGTFALAKAAGKKKVGVLYCAESPICAELIPLSQGAAKLYGLETTAAKVSSTAPSYTAPCLAMKGQNVDALFPAVQSSAALRIVDACAQQGYKPTTLGQNTTTTNAWLKDPNIEGAVLSGASANAYDTSTPAVANFQQQLNNYQSGFSSSPGFNQDLIGTWTGGLLFQAAAKAANLGPNSTGADVKKGLYALKNETLDGLAPPLNYTPGKPTFVPCYFGVKVTGGKFASLNGNKPSCLTAAQTGALLKALHLG
jgi:branched-chain amino acid transport system substrate-binding protein